MSLGWRLRSFALLGAAAAALAGCASALDVRYPESDARPALLSSVAPRRVAIAPVVDRRLQQARIGDDPTSRDPIVTRRPAGEIVREALAIEIARNGHPVVTDAPDVLLSPELEEFWIDSTPLQGATQYVGRVSFALSVVDAHTGGRLLTRRYVGIKRLHAGSDAPDAWRQVLDAALARSMRDVATDPELVAALSPR
jgi:hypothetical protein